MRMVSDTMQKSWRRNGDYSGRLDVPNLLNKFPGAVHGTDAGQGIEANCLIRPVADANTRSVEGVIVNFTRSIATGFQGKIPRQFEIFL
jgi:hypothetical protein